jgi:diguanylate cyclase (GGDEF)-like protein
MGYVAEIVLAVACLIAAYAAGWRRARRSETQRSFDELELIHEKLTDAVDDARNAETSAALLVIGLDVNDTFGHEYGDQVLRRVAERLPAELRGRDTVGRLGGDQFAVILPDADVETACVVAERLIEVLEAPMEVEGQVPEVGATTGVVVFPEHGGNPDTLLRHADVAMHAAKNHHRRLLVYGPDLDENSLDRTTLVSDLRRAIDNDELVLHYQPTVAYSTRSVHCAEALVRWRHPSRGLVPPGDFIPLAERTGLIAPLGNWVLRSAIRQLAEWHEANLEFAVAVNLSQRNLADPDLPDVVEGLLAQYNVAPECLVLEVTESTLMSDPALAVATTGRLRDMGVSLSIDDFGTGYSSLAHLSRLPVEELKIDRSFIQQMAAEPADSVIVRSTISLAHELGLRIVAEGVEDVQTLDLLERLGADVAQGFHIARPMPAEDLVTWLADSPWGSGAPLPDPARATDQPRA